MTIGSSVYST
ncbi:hypothetical protein RDI58_000815 [Solanum bulbocastanum]|uniref:Uncharacterized protein n=1 Tax=Solanum bulbocastanum TaxID=147425 RepID=A0AAN8UD32_SOLBU